MTTLLATVPTSMCQPWCWLHDPETGVCLGAPVRVDFTTPGRLDWKATDASTALSYSAEGGVSISVSVYGPTREMTPDDTEKLAVAMLGLVATARRAGAR